MPKYDRDMQRQVRLVIASTKGGRTKEGMRINATELKFHTYNLVKYIYPRFEIQGDVLNMEMEVMHYYKYLDEGTRKIKYAWPLTEKLFARKEVRRIIKGKMTHEVNTLITKVLSQIK